MEYRPLLGRDYIMKVTQISQGGSPQENKIQELIKDILFENVVLNPKKEMPTYPNKLDSSRRQLYSGLIGTTYEVVIDLELCRHNKEKYDNNSARDTLSDIRIGKLKTKFKLDDIFEQINDINLNVGDLIEVCFKMGVMESYGRCGYKSAFNKINLKYDDEEAYNLVIEDVTNLYKQFKRDFIFSNIVKHNSKVIVNPLVGSEKGKLKGDGDFIIDDTLYEIKTYTNEMYNEANVYQAMIYMLIWNRNYRLNNDKYMKTKWRVDKVAIYNPRYNKVIKIRFKENDIEIIEDNLQELIYTNVKYYTGLQDQIISSLDWFKGFERLPTPKKVEMIDDFLSYQGYGTQFYKSKNCMDFYKDLIKIVHYEITEGEWLQLD